MNLRTYTSAEERRRAIEEKRQLSLQHTSVFSLDEATASKRNCENMIGATQIPLGIAGPLTIENKEYYLPLATTEGALVASVSRGCKVITESSGVNVEVERTGATRGPVFRIQHLEEGKKFKAFLAEHFSELQTIAAATSHHLKLLSYSLSGVGNYRFVRFVYDTQDAMGLNMVTIATEAVAKYIYEQTQIQCLSVSGNFCVDKKPSWQNFLHTRGFVVRSEVVISEGILSSVLHTSAHAMHEGWLAKCMLGSVMSGSMGYNAQYANIIAAMFLATGQDPAHVVEGSMGVTTTEVRDQDLYISIYLPSLMVGTVGGGTALGTQQEALAILGVAGGNEGKNSLELAKIIGGAVLAGEISLLASLSEGSLAHAHQKLGRGV